VRTASLIVVNSAVRENPGRVFRLREKKGVRSNVSGVSRTTTQLLPELFRVNCMSNCSMCQPRKWAIPTMISSAGRVDMMCYPAIGLQPFLNSGAVRALAVASSERVQIVARRPTVGEALGPQTSILFRVWIIRTCWNAAFRS